MMNDLFRRSLGEWSRKVSDLTPLARVACQDLAEKVVDGTRIDTGFLVANWQPALDAPDLSEVEGLGNGYAQSRIGVVVAQIKAGDVFYYTNNAAYARRMEHGFVGYDSLGRYYNQKGDHNVIGAVAQWTLIVNEAAVKLGLATK
jgi:hypothetical protein